ncbi:hypothetical protein [Ilumatobacter sp.]|uniref:hypothetical protein n=1 Tax=Ilumatobacter sp. TaxID=1967498 RepID=UPI003753E5B4
MSNDVLAEPVDWPPLWEITLGDCPTALAWDPSGSRLAAASLAGDVVVAETADGSQQQVSFHNGGALCLDWAVARLASGGQDGTATIDGDPIELGRWVSALASSQCGRHVAVGHGRSASVLDVASCATLSSERHNTTVTGVCWHPTNDDVVRSGSFERIAEQEIGVDAALPDIELEFGGAIAAVRVAASTERTVAGVRGDFAYLWHDAGMSHTANRNDSQQRIVSGRG